MFYAHTGSSDEKWFYLITAAMEARGASVIQLAHDSQKAVEEKDTRGLISQLQSLEAVIKGVSDLFLRMPERCDPYIFYHRVRKYLTGSYNCDALPNGIYFGKEETPRR